jgi:hypothetical protein
VINSVFKTVQHKPRHASVTQSVGQALCWRASSSRLAFHEVAKRNNACTWHRVPGARCWLLIISAKYMEKGFPSCMASLPV